MYAAVSEHMCAKTLLLFPCCLCFC